MVMKFRGFRGASSALTLQTVFFMAAYKNAYYLSTHQLALITPTWQKWRKKTDEAQKTAQKSLDQHWDDEELSPRQMGADQ